MNEKFFDLKKEKQDRMINAGLRVFSLNGYHHASTDDIVKEAHISKGLLFHYFGSKAGYYAFLYDYITRFAILELTQSLRSAAGMDYFDLEERLLVTESYLMEQYPFIYLFLESIKLEDDGEGLAVLEAPDKDITTFYAELYEKADASAYTKVQEISRMTEIIHYIKIGVMREYLIDRTNPISLYSKRMAGYLTELRRMASN